MRPISLEEVKTTNFSLAIGKAPDLDGFTSEFFHNCWSIIKLDVGDPPALNETFLSLIHKEEKSTDPNKFCPITLCNFFYKIISKVIDLQRMLGIPLL
jgi:hypothetical protein